MKSKTPRTDALRNRWENPSRQALEVYSLASDLETELGEARQNLKLQIAENMRVAEDIWNSRQALRKALRHLESGIFRDFEEAKKVAIAIRIILSNAEPSNEPTK